VCESKTSENEISLRFTNYTISGRKTIKTNMPEDELTK